MKQSEKDSLRRGLSQLQSYYDTVSKERGWDNETARDTLLLMLEEVGELARAVRKESELKRAAGYDQVELEDELADVQLYLVHLANILKIDLAESVIAKEAKNAAAHKRKKTT